MLFSRYLKIFSLPSFKSDAFMLSVELTCRRVLCITGGLFAESYVHMNLEKEKVK